MANFTKVEKNRYPVDSAIRPSYNRPQYIIRYFRRNYIQKPPPDFKTLYCSWQVYSSDKHLKRTKKTDLIMF